MSKLIAIANVIAWSGFWAFGYVALSSQEDHSGHIVTALILAAVGAGIGLFSWLWLVRHSENTGYAPRQRRKLPTDPAEEDG